MFAQSNPYPEMIELVSQLKVRGANGMRIGSHGIRSILHAGYESTCAELTAFGLQHGERGIHETR
jgi:hypothetical protein